MVVLQVPEEGSLVTRFNRVSDAINRVMVAEPDLAGENTAFAVLGTEAGRVLSDLPLCMKELAMV